uniref:Retrovirus-related Pol polyprotein from transposon TNT 1-94 n=1 Tax=Tanacetum cinerariifolium TaxID=118510 RepID=A0A6L2JVZ7_TANCI|nr:retrovirus-related Pol polyprotein from transposon TNT 1-94 [Tanacetum cinerariifolium]
MVLKIKDWVESPDSKLLNFNTVIILVPESQAVNESLETLNTPESSKDSEAEFLTPTSPNKPSGSFSKLKGNAIDLLTPLSKKETMLRKPIWYLYNGCSRSMTGVKSYLHKYAEQPGPKQGTIFNANKEIVLIAPRRNNVYVLDMSSLTPNGACFFAKASESINWLWHKRLSHLNFKNNNKLAKQNKLLGLPSLVYSKDKPCTICEKGKHHRALFKNKQNFSIRKCLHLLHMDLLGPDIEDPSDLINTEGTHEQNIQDDQMITQPTDVPLVNNTPITEPLVLDVTQSYIPNQASASSHLASQDRWSRDQHIKLVNIISNIREDMITSSMAAKLIAASASEYLFADFLSEIEPKKVNKKDEHGTTTKNKARLVAQGYSQEEEIDYNETFAPVARVEAIRIFLAFATYMNCKVYQRDVKSAFLNGKMKEEVYVKQPPGFESSEFPDYVCKLDNALYGLKQAPKAHNVLPILDLLLLLNLAPNHVALHLSESQLLIESQLLVAYTLAYFPNDKKNPLAFLLSCILSYMPKLFTIKKMIPILLHYEFPTFSLFLTRLTAP